MRKMIFLAIFISLLLGMGSARLHAESDTRIFLAKLEDNFSLINTICADFVQEKELSYFDKKIRIKGVMCFDKPDFFGWHVTEPIVYSMVINGKTIRQWDEETRKVQTIHVESNPALQIMIVRMREWFTGNFTGFLEDYDFTIENKDPVILVFVPKETSPVADFIEKVKIIFKEDESYIRQIEINEKGGDRDVLIFDDVVLNEPLNPGLRNVKDNI